MTHTQTLAIHKDLTIYQAQPLKDELLAGLAAGDRLELDLAGVAEIDTAGLQLLLLVKREAARQNKALAITAHSPAVQQTLDFCNLVGVFGDPMVIPARP